tara:strand:+ start:954 stop:1166 length:213 start_codon:yes stop_codon:yes gene_type:complete
LTACGSIEGEQKYTCEDTMENKMLNNYLDVWLEMKETSMGEHPPLNPFENDEEIIAECDLENPEECESCQ